MTGGKRSTYYAYGAGKGNKGGVEDEGGPPELVVHSHPKSAVAEAARAIRTNLIFASPDKPYQTLLVTSAGPAEGKTTVATSVAIAMAQAGQRVCLVDCDLRRPRVHHLFHLTNEHGVTTALIEPDRLDQMIQPCPVPNSRSCPRARSRRTRPSSCTPSASTRSSRSSSGATIAW